MIRRHTVTIQSSTAGTPTGDGIPTKTWATFKADLRCDVQPKYLTEGMAQEWGISTLASKCKVMFYDLDETITEGMRVVFETKTYEIRGVNVWVRHSEAILVPLQGVA